MAPTQRTTARHATEGAKTTSDTSPGPIARSGKRRTRREAFPDAVPLPRSEAIVPARFTPGSIRCQCMRCGLRFSSTSAFDFHQTVLDDGTVQCWEPSSLGMVERDGWWGQRGDPRYAKE